MTDELKTKEKRFCASKAAVTPPSTVPTYVYHQLIWTFKIGRYRASFIAKQLLLHWWYLEPVEPVF